MARRKQGPEPVGLLLAVVVIALVAWFGYWILLAPGTPWGPNSQ